MELELRAWLKQDKIMVEVIQWISTGRIGVLIQDSGPFILEPKHYDLMIYSGHKDIDNKKIFTGDVVECSFDGCQFTGEVVFEQGTFCLRSLHSYGDNPRELLTLWDDGQFRWTSLENTTASDLKVVGHIYEEPWNAIRR